MTDGCATDPQALDEAIRQIHYAEQSREIEFVPLMPAPADADRLQAIFGKEPILADEVKFDLVFAAFTRSLSRYSQSSPGVEPDAMSLIRNELQHSPHRPGIAAQNIVPRLPYKGD